MLSLRRLFATVVLAVASMTVVVSAGHAGIVGTITGIAPASGPTAGGTRVTITGTYLKYGTSSTGVTVGGVDATVVSADMNQVVIVTPAGTAGAKDVVVKAVDYQQTLATRVGGFTYVAPAPDTPPIAVTAVAPASGLSTGAEPVTITGSGFAGGSAPAVTFGGTAATDVTVVNDTTITATTPAHAAGGVDVAVSRDGGTGTKTGAYTYTQGYWLTVKTTRPASIGSLESPGAIRTPSFGDWAKTSVTSTGGSGLLNTGTTTTVHTGYAGGVNCGARRVERRGILLFGKATDESWSAGACSYAFPSGTKVALSALPSSSNFDFIRNLSLKFESGFVGAWRNDCSTATTDTCTLQMSANRTVGATWGYMSLGILGLYGNVVVPTYNSAGELQYYNAFVLMVGLPKVVGGTPQYFAIMTAPVKTAGASEQGATPTRTKVVCRARAHIVGRRLAAQCGVSPWLAQTLKHGSVRATTTWYVRLPHSSQLQPISRGRAMLRGRRTSAVTG